MNIENVHYKYEDGTEALNDINMDLSKGNVIGVIGAKGSGK